MLEVGEVPLGQVLERVLGLVPVPGERLGQRLVLGEEGGRTVAVEEPVARIEVVAVGLLPAPGPKSLRVRFRHKKDIRCRKGRLLFHTWGRSR